jgi:hypothetical protein
MYVLDPAVNINTRLQSAQNIINLRSANPLFTNIATNDGSLGEIINKISSDSITDLIASFKATWSDIQTTGKEEDADTDTTKLYTIMD